MIVIYDSLNNTHACLAILGLFLSEQHHMLFALKKLMTHIWANLFARLTVDQETKKETSL